MKKCLTLLLAILALSSITQAQSNCNLYTNEVANAPKIKVGAKTLKKSTGNLYDVSWLDKEVKGKKVVLIGESHWMTSIQNIGKSIVFHLNTTDSFPVLVREIPFSTTPFFNAYINCESGNCEDLLQIVKPYASSEEEQSFLRELRQWNSDHPTKKITIACSDFEQGFQFPLRNVFMPFFAEQGHTNFRERLIAANNDTELVFAYMDSLMEQTPAGFHLKDKPYVNKEFAEKVYDNLKAFTTASLNMQKAIQAGKTEGEAFEEFSKIRTESIKKNLTDDARFGKLIKDQKSIVWAGASHSRKYKLDSEDHYTYGEGDFLANTYEPTKGKTLAIKIMSMSYDIPDAYFTSDTYKSGVDQFQRLVEAYKNCNQQQEKNIYKMVEETTSLTDAVTAHFRENSNQPVWLASNTQMAKLLKKSPGLKEDNQLKSFYAFDYVIVLPYSTLFTHKGQ